MVAIVFGAKWLTQTLMRSPRIQKALNYSFAAVFTAFALTILTAEARK